MWPLVVTEALSWLCQGQHPGCDTVLQDVTTGGKLRKSVWKILQLHQISYNYMWIYNYLKKSLIQIIKWEGLPGGPVAKTLYAQFGGQGSVPALGARSHSLQPRVQMPQVKCHVLHAATKTQYSQIYKYFLSKIQIKKKNSKSVWL